MGDLHEGVWYATMIDVVGTVSSAAAVKTPTVVDRADSQRLPVCPAVGFSV